MRTSTSLSPASTIPSSFLGNGSILISGISLGHKPGVDEITEIIVNVPVINKKWGHNVNAYILFSLEKNDVKVSSHITS